MQSCDCVHCILIHSCQFGNLRYKMTGWFVTQLKGMMSESFDISFTFNISNLQLNHLRKELNHNLKSNAVSEYYT